MAKEKLVASPSAKQEERTRITYVITQLCIDTKDASYVDVSRLTLPIRHTVIGAVQNVKHTLPTLNLAF